MVERAPLGLSLITYTYNEHAFTLGLLEYAKTFGLPFREVVVVDDASAEPFEAEPFAASCPWPVKVVRPPRNVGPGQAKRLGLDAAGGDVMLSLDADIRPHAKWPAHSLSLLQHPAVGMVGTIPVPARTASFLGKALYRAAAHADGRAEGVVEASFLAAGCMMLRKDVWRRVGGLEDFSGRAFEDYHLSRKLTAHGYTLLHNAAWPVYEIRHLHRTAHCRRVAAYEKEPVAAVVARHGLERYLADLAEPARVAAADAAQSGDPVLAYVFVLKLAYMLALLGSGLPDGLDGALPGVLSGLEAYPKTAALLRDDLARMGVTPAENGPGESFAPPSSQADGPAHWAERYGLLPALEALEERWVDAYREEDARLRFDSHYTDGALP